MMNDMTMMEMTMAPMPVRSRITDNSRRTSQKSKDESSQPSSSSLRTRRHQHNQLLMSHDDLLKILPVVQPRRRQSLSHPTYDNNNETTAFKMIGTGSVSCCSPHQFKCMKRRFTTFEQQQHPCVKAKSMSAQRSWRNLRSLSLMNISHPQQQQRQQNSSSSSTSFTTSSDEAVAVVTSIENTSSKKFQTCVHKVITMIQKYQWSKLLKFFGLNHPKSQENAHYKRIVQECWKQMSPLLLVEVMQPEHNAETETSSSSEGSLHQDKVSPNDGTSLLHVMCQSHPPLNLVEYFMSECPFDPKTILEVSDLSNRHTPLHVAAKYGANPRVIRYLLRGAPYLASWKDVEGKTPLHLHCEHTCGTLGTCDPSSFSKKQHEEYAQRVHDSKIQQFLLYNQYYYCTQKEDSSQHMDYDTERFRTFGPIWNVIDMLHDASPSSINEEDLSGCNPIEYCLFDHNDNSKPSATQQVVLEYTKEMLQKMQRLSIQQWNTVGNRPRGRHPPKAATALPLDVHK